MTHELNTFSELDKSKQNEAHRKQEILQLQINRNKVDINRMVFVKNEAERSKLKDIISTGYMFNGKFHKNGRQREITD